MFGGKSSFMPLEGAAATASRSRTPYSKEQVKDAPRIEAEGELSQQEEAALYAHYGLDYGEWRSDSGLPEGAQERPARERRP